MLAGANGVCACMVMPDDHCSKALFRELKGIIEHIDEI
jgi:hypothetical protein